MNPETKARIIVNLKRWVFNHDFNFIKALVALAVLVFLCLALINQFGPVTKTNDDFSIVLSMVSMLVLGGTFFAIFWNTLETKSLKELQMKQINLSLKPILIIFKKHHPNHGDVDTIKNIGLGVANNIKFEELQDSGGFKHQFNTKKLLAPQEEYRVEMSVLGSMLPPIFSFINLFRNEKIVLKVDFEDIDGMPYRTNLEIDKGEIRIINQV